MSAVFELLDVLIAKEHVKCRVLAEEGRRKKGDRT
jgi:hypothetical protein